VLDPKNLALPLHAFTPPRESAGRQKRNARTGLGCERAEHPRTLSVSSAECERCTAPVRSGAAVRGGEPASLRAGERVRVGVGKMFELGRIM
jgi:hypothetical protein